MPDRVPEYMSKIVSVAGDHSKKAIGGCFLCRFGICSIVYSDCYWVAYILYILYILCIYIYILCIYIYMYTNIQLYIYQQYRTRRWRKFQNRKPIGEVGCCDSRMAERIHWWTESWLELCFLEWLQWLQWSPHPQLLDVVWCSAAVVVVVM